MSLEKVVQSIKRSKKGIKGKTLGLLLGVALLASVSGCRRKVEIKAPTMPVRVLRPNGVIAGVDIVKETYDNVLIPNDGKPEFYVGLDKRAVTFYVDNDFKDKVGNFEIICFGRGKEEEGFKIKKCFDYSKYKPGIYSDSIEISASDSIKISASAQGFDFVLVKKYYDDMEWDILYKIEEVKHFYRANGKTIIWNFY